MEKFGDKCIINYYWVLKVIFCNYYINKSVFKEKRAYLSDAGAPCATFLFQHFCSALLSLDVAFVELVLINANANAKSASLFLTLHIGKIIQY